MALSKEDFGLNYILEEVLDSVPAELLFYIPLNSDSEYNDEDVEYFINSLGLLVVVWSIAGSPLDCISIPRWWQCVGVYSNEL